MTTRELINHLEDLIKEGKVTDSTEVFTLTITTDCYGYTDYDENPFEKDCVDVKVIESPAGISYKLILDARWG
jgi:hypothetical protein